MLIVAIDWSQSKHDVVLMEPQGKLLERLCVSHDAPGLEHLARRIAARQSDPTQVRVAIELHDGGLLAWLLEQKYQVFGINPMSAKRAREAYRPAGGKDDKSDALILAEFLRLEAGALRPVQPRSTTTLELVGLTEHRTSLVQDRTAVVLRLRTLLSEWCPAWGRLCDNPRLRWQHDLLSLFPLHQDLVAASPRTVRAFLGRHRPQEEARRNLEQVRREAPLFIPAGRVQTLRLQVQQMLAQIALLDEQVDQIDKLIQEKVEQHPDATIFRSLPVKGASTIAHLLAGFGDDRQGCPNPGRLAAAWGVAPLTVASGKLRQVCRRWTADWHMGQALLQLAFNSARDPSCWAKAYYERKRREGAEHFTALRCLARCWVRILTRMWKDRVPYDEQHHRQDQRRRREQASAARATNRRRAAKRSVTTRNRAAGTRRASRGARASRARR